MNEEKKRLYTDEEWSAFFRRGLDEAHRQEDGALPSLDKSFLEQDEPQASRRKRYSVIAAAAAVILCITFALPSFIGVDAAYGEKGILHRIYSSVMGIGTDEGVDGAEDRETLVIYDLEKAEDAKNLCPDLYVPKYVPNGFELESLVVEKNNDGVTFADYVFQRKAPCEASPLVGDICA